ncbi:hypothetical protein PAXRUDRAFT_164093 [Paxillus rubicundulus Ve08.2h10]|uniref:Unplaced genomic scaffold scaffold_1778, whole genome shotgun sequence n=1 Tax=Paxillus rubicundulus Ve08.2h10 TaxID=930991 RepID=A0A0D0DJU6_9AGAM|nr:hypothetical protein PAXRUDRAFT_164093 [Paxillus rubicundulus Ve08.2h10]
MDIEELLNPAKERQDLFEATDQDICNAVMEAKVAQENTAAAGGSNELDNSDESVKPPHTHKEALQAALILEEYISELDGPFAQKLEPLLGSFGKQTRFIDSDMQRLKDPNFTSCFESK